jgi:alpha-tubulin suppressor-like RCC1 family protein
MGRVANARGSVVAAVSFLGVVGACFYAEPRERSVDGGIPSVDGAPAATPTDADSSSDVPTCPDEAGCTLPRVVQIAAGGSHTCARLADGSLRCWGANSRGELGDGATTDRLQPTPVVGISAATDVAVGGGHSCAITRDGAAYCWGANGAGSVGDGTFDARATPQRVLELPPVVKLACGGHSCARDASGAVFCWGINQNGQLGDGTRGARAVATPVLAPAGADGDGGARALTGITSLSVGATHMCALDGAGHALCWGSSSLIGVAAGGRETTRPIQLEWTGFLSLSAGAEHTCARMADRAVRCWGNDAVYQLGTPAPHAAPESVPNLPPTTDVWSGDSRTYARLEDGAIWAWGRLPLGSADGGPPVELPALSSVAEIAVGESHTCARFTDGTVRCWGQNTYGQLGDGTREDRRLPTPVAW